MKKYIVIILLIFFLDNATLTGQILHEQYSKSTDSLRIGKGTRDFLPYNSRGYTLILPDSSTTMQGVLISLEEDQFDLTKSNQQVYPAAIKKGFGVLYISTGVPVDLFFSEKSLRFVDSTINRTFKQFNLTRPNVFFLGVSLAGHRCMKYIEYYRKGKSKSDLIIKGVILVESVLDWVRQWYEEKKGIKDNFAPSAVFEGKMVTYLLEKNLKGNPKTNPEPYLNFSSYSYFDDRNRNLKYYKDLPIRTYSEPATYYWMNERRKGVFDTNFPDMVGVINELKLLGNNQNELIVFQQDKQNMDRRNPYYTWGLVDKEDLVNWLILHLK